MTDQQKTTDVPCVGSNDLLWLVSELRERYKERKPPNCPVCGHARDRITSIGMGCITYCCGSDAANPMGKPDAEREEAWKHFGGSGYAMSMIGDADVLRLCDYVEQHLSHNNR